MAKENLVKFMQRLQVIEPSCDVKAHLTETPIEHLMSEASDYNLPFTETELKELLETI